MVSRFHSSEKLPSGPLLSVLKTRGEFTLMSEAGSVRFEQMGRVWWERQSGVHGASWERDTDRGQPVHC